MTRSISILGATGSVGEQTLDLISRNRDEWLVEVLTANCSASKLGQMARDFDAKHAVVGDESCLPELREALAGTDIEAAGGRKALCEAASRAVDITVASIVGCAGLGPVMAAIERGGTVALANKEALVSAGEVMTAAGRETWRDAAPGRQRAQCDLPVPARSQARRRRANYADRQWWSISRMVASATRSGDARAGGCASQLGHGRQDQRRQRNDDEQGSRVYRGASSLPRSGSSA